ncbi:MAG: TetR family transcriptional regulator [Lachnospiraceae bacterium]|nr:TetR family transcriptional regulator [Lachnospiraceae bacterium]
MNPKFFDVKKQKQDAIINAALMVFSENGYRKSSTDVIVKAAGISKGLLFHYFISKQGVYEFIYDYSLKYMMIEFTQIVDKNETDFFVIQRMIEIAKLRIMKNYPYMLQFINSVKYETHPDALEVIEESGNTVDDMFEDLYSRVDMSKFNRPVDVHKVIKMISWMSDGFVKDKFREGTPNLDEMNEEFIKYLDMMRDHFYRQDIEKTDILVEDLVSERDETVMDIMRDEPFTIFPVQSPEPKIELSFEERLARGKKSAYAQEPDKAAGDDEENIKEEDNILRADEEEMMIKEILNEAADTGEIDKEEEDVIESSEETIETEEVHKEEEDVIESSEETAETEEVHKEEEDVIESSEETADKGKVYKEEENIINSPEKTAETEEVNKEEDIIESSEGTSEGEEVNKEEDNIIENPIETADTEAADNETLISTMAEDSEAGSEEKTAEIKGDRKDSGVLKEEEADKDAESENILSFVTGEGNKEENEVVISVDMYETGYMSYRNTVEPDSALYSVKVSEEKVLSEEDIKVYEKSRLGDFSYGADERGGRGIPSDSSENIQIFVAEDEEVEEAAEESKEPSSLLADSKNDEDNESGEDFLEVSKESKEPEDEKDIKDKQEKIRGDEIDVDSLGEKIVLNTNKESEERERVKELESMGPAPVLPDFLPENMASSPTIEESEDEDVHIYRPLVF